ncbi:MAG: type II toxin-antitoxin system HicA family toxin, partial [Planctomycetia bacterium]
GQGSRVRIALNGLRAVFHRPHPHKETDRGAVKSMRRFLSEAGVQP